MQSNSCNQGIQGGIGHDDEGWASVDVEGSVVAIELRAGLLGPGGKKLIVAGGKWEIDLQEQVYLKGDLYRIRFDDAVVSMTLTADRRDRLNWNCTACENVCEHVGAAFALVLEEKMALGLAVAPPERVVVDSLAEDKLISQALAERELRAHEEKFAFTTADSAIPWTDIP